MNTNAAAFVAGAATAAAALIYSGVNGPAAAFVAGILVSLIALAGVMASRKRLRSIAAFLNRLAGSTPTQRRANAPASPEPAEAPLQADLTAALVQLGAKKPAAVAAVARAIAGNPAGDFDSLFRAALQFSKA